MATFLQLCQDTHENAGLSGSGPASVSGQSGMAKKIVNWVKNAWYEIQSLHPDWRWMWKDDGLVTCVANQREYDLTGLGFDVNYIIRETPRRRVSGQPGTDMWLVWYEYADFRSTFLYGPVRYGIPNAVTIDPMGNMLLDPVPNDAYEVRFEYHKKPVLMTASGDIPECPVKFHDMIMYRALMKYGAHDGAADVYQDAKGNYEMWERRLEAEQLPVPVQAGTLA